MRQVGSQSFRSRATLALLVIGLFIGTSILSACGPSSTNSKVEVASPAGNTDDVESVGFDHFDITAALAEPTTTPTTTPTTRLPEPTELPTTSTTQPPTEPTAVIAPLTLPTLLPAVLPVATLPPPRPAPPVKATVAKPAKAPVTPLPTQPPLTTPEPATAPVTTPRVTTPPTAAPTLPPPTSPSTTVVAPTPTGTPNAPLIGPGFDGKTIKIGVLSTTTNPVWGNIGKALKAGLEARIASVNRRGGIAGRYKVEITFADTNYDASQTIAQLNSTKDSVVSYAQILGTPNVEAVDPFLRQSQLVASPASQDARWALAPNLMPIGNSYQVQAINAISYFLEQSALTNPTVKPTVCAASVSTSFGDTGTEGFRFAQERLGFTAGPVVNIGPAETTMTAYSAQLKAAGCSAVMVTVGPVQTLGLVVSSRLQGFSPRWIIMGASFSDRIVVPQTGPLFEQGAWVVGDGSQWGDTSIPGMATIRNDLIAADHRYWTENPDVGLVFGYMQGRVVEAMLEKAVTLGDLSRPGILNASRQVGPVDTLGLLSTIDYTQAVRLSSARSTIFAVDASYPNAIKTLARDYSSPTAQAYKK